MHTVLYCLVYGGICLSNLANKYATLLRKQLMATKENSKPSQTSEMELFPQVATDFRGELRILSSKMKLSAKIVKN